MFHHAVHSYLSVVFLFNVLHTFAKNICSSVVNKNYFEHAARRSNFGVNVRVNSFFLGLLNTQAQNISRLILAYEA